MGKITWLGSAKPDDPIYLNGPMVSFKPPLTPSTGATAKPTDGAPQPEVTSAEAAETPLGIDPVIGLERAIQQRFGPPSTSGDKAD